MTSVKACPPSKKGTVPHELQKNRRTWIHHRTSLVIAGGHVRASDDNPCAIANKLGCGQISLCRSFQSIPDDCSSTAFACKSFNVADALGNPACRTRSKVHATATQSKNEQLPPPPLLAHDHKWKDERVQHGRTYSSLFRNDTSEVTADGSVRFVALYGRQHTRKPVTRTRKPAEQIASLHNVMWSAQRASSGHTPQAGSGTRRRRYGIGRIHHPEPPLADAGKAEIWRRELGGGRRRRGESGRLGGREGREGQAEKRGERKGEIHNPLLQAHARTHAHPKTRTRTFST